MSKIKIFIIILAIAGAVGVFFWQDLIGLYARFSLKLPQIEKGVSGLVQEAGKQIFTPPPLRAEKEAQRAFLAQEGVIADTNAERAKAGLPALKESLKLDASAKEKVLDMFKNQYFAHESPAGLGVGDLAEKAGYEFLIIGENLAEGNFANDAVLVDAWMNSPGHRANILNSRFQEIGAAVIKGTFEGQTTWLAVQEFGLPLSACPALDQSLKAKIQADQAQLDSAETLINSSRQELESMSHHDSSYVEAVNAYNALVAQYNTLVAATKQLINTYNSQVTQFNQCVTQ